MRRLSLRAILLRMSISPWPIRLATAAAGVALLSAAFPQAQQRGATPERGVDLVTVDLVALTTGGLPVSDLKAEELTVRVGGRRRAVRSLQLISPPETPPGADPALPSPFGTNAASATGRALVLIIDDDSFRVGREVPLREAVDRLIASLSPRDRLSLVTMPYGGLKVPLTTEHARVRTALSRIVGQASASETGSELACRTRRTLESLVGYLDSNFGIRETPVTIMFITGGLAGPRRDAPVTMAPGMCELTSDMFEQVGVAAGASRANFYVIQPGDMMATPGVQRENIAGADFRGSDNPLEGIEHLAGVTGGRMLPLTGSAEGGLERVLRESASYYLVGLDPTATDRSGRSQQLEVRVSRPNVQVRTRPHITFRRPETVNAAPTNPSPREMLSVATVFRDLPLRASAYAALDPDGQSLRVVTLAETVEPDVKIGSLMAALYDQDGKVTSSWAATAEELQRSPIIGAMPAAIGAYRLRVAAIDTTGRSGTVDYDLEAEVVRTGPLRLSSLILGLSREGRFSPKLRFTTEPVAIGYLEMYGGSPGLKISSALEIARTLNGPPLAAVPFAIESAGADRYVATGAIPIGTLEPGDYIVRALIGLEGQALTRVVRTLRKAPR
jgi:VWFA-related protein